MAGPSIGHDDAKYQDFVFCPKLPLFYPWRQRDQDIVLHIETLSGWGWYTYQLRYWLTFLSFIVFLAAR